MGSALWKDILREIKKSLGRFFSIMMIVAIGVAFFAGVKASVPDMKHTADKYFDDYHLMDIRVLSTFGLTEDDVKTIQKIDGIEGVFATHTQDVLTKLDGEQYALKVHALPMNTEQDNENYINRVELTEGRLPQTSGECAVQETTLNRLDLEIGDKLILESGSEAKLSESIKTSEYTVVGKVKSPYYLSPEIGSTDIGSGKLGFYVMIPQSDFVSDIYTEINLTIKDARDYNSYEDAYFEHIDTVKTALEAIAPKRNEIRFEQVKQSAVQELEKHQREYEDGKKQYEKEIKAGEVKLEAAKQELSSGRKKLTTEKQKTADKFTSYKKQLADGKKQLNTAKQTYETNVKAFEATETKLTSQLSQMNQQITALNRQIQECDEQLKVYNEQLNNPDLSEAERTQIKEALASLEAGKQLAQDSLSKLETTKQTMEYQLKQGAEQLKQAEEMLQSQEAQLLRKEAELKAGEAKANKEFAAAEAKLIQGQREYDNGVKELAEAKADGQADLDKGKEKLEKARSDIDAMERPKWYVLDRKSHYSYMDYGSVADRMDGIAKVFPLFFFLVAALVCLTTMTRMVDEQRNNIGTMKALGYGKNAIALKFILYALIASVIGSIIGCSLGMTIFPTVIFDSWNIMYTLPSISFVAQPVLAFSAGAIVTLITVAAAFTAVYKELTETPALLMRPKAPKAGKKILLEHITPLWKRLSFIQKVTARNLFRYKKRFLMTVIGISGCSALLVAGFGIQDSISTVVTKQYGEILKYDASLQLKDDTSTSELKEMKKQLQADSRIAEVTALTMDNITVPIDDESASVTLITPSDPKAMTSFISLHARGSQKEIALSQDGALISEKLSMNSGAAVGDLLKIEDKDGAIRKIKVVGIVENYIGHYIYLSPSYYKKVFHTQPYDNAFVFKLKQSSNQAEQELGNDLMKHDIVSSLSFYRGTAESFSDMISSLSIVVVVLVVAAGLLAFIVLYNLTNVNVSERLREIATIKVLGFYDPEVAQYVYRENILLTMIGSLCGLLLGIGLHQLIMSLAEMEHVMFGRNIDLSSFLISFGITMLFGFIVNIVMYRKLKKIPMVESLKSVE